MMLGKMEVERKFGATGKYYRRRRLRWSTRNPAGVFRKTTLQRGVRLLRVESKELKVHRILL